MERFQRNQVNGRFLKGHEPHNKGKKWDEWMDGRKQKRVRRIGLKNLKPRMDIGGWNKTCVIQMNAKGEYRLFSSQAMAGQITGIAKQNIGKVCRGERKKAGGFFWFFWEDDKWVEKKNEIEENLRKQKEEELLHHEENLYRERLNYINKL